MGLPTGQQRVLERIEGKLAESDPRLVSLFVIFTRLNWAEAMPWIEQLKVRPVLDHLARLAAWCRWLAKHRIRAIVLFPAAITAVACAVTIAFGFPGGHRLVPGSRTAISRHLVVKPRVCRLGLIRIPSLAC